ncbi:MAG: nodulation protein NfeD [Armatimonadota bacterium]
MQWGCERSRKLCRIGLVALCLGAWAGAAAAGNEVHVLTVTGTVSPAMERYIERGLREAQVAEAQCVVLRLDTPGGLMDTTRCIVADILASPVPVVVYVWPSGGRAASAGAFIVLSGHVAAMAPSTNIGASSPVFMGGGTPGGEEEESESASRQLETLLKKATHDAAAFIRAIAEKRGRNAEWAELAVREGVAASERQALEKNVVDLVARDLEDLLTQCEGRTVEVEQGEVTLKTEGAPVVENEMRFEESLLLALAHPNLAYILLLVGIYGLIFELRNPGFGGSGIVGAICLVLGLYSLSVLDFYWAGLLLILMGVGFFVAEIKVPSHGLLTVGGAAALFFGSIMLFPKQQMSVSLPLIVGMTALTTVFFLACITAGLASQRRKVVTGTEGLVGLHGIVRRAVDPEGQVFVDGALWRARAEEPLEAGTVVEVEAAEGLLLTVRRSEAIPEERA